MADKYVFRGCTVIVGVDELAGAQVVFIVNQEGAIVFQAPGPETIMRKYTPDEVDLLLQHISASPMKDAITKAWKEIQEPPS